MKAPEYSLSSCVSSMLWLISSSLPPSCDLAARARGEAARCHCSMNFARWTLKGVAKAPIVPDNAAWWPSPNPIASVNSRF